MTKIIQKMCLRWNLYLLKRKVSRIERHILEARFAH